MIPHDRESRRLGRALKGMATTGMPRIELQYCMAMM
jgi:hypothetical protein